MVVLVCVFFIPRYFGNQFSWCWDRKDEMLFYKRKAVVLLPLFFSIYWFRIKPKIDLQNSFLLNELTFSYTEGSGEHRAPQKLAHRRCRHPFWPDTSMFLINYKMVYLNCCLLWGVISYKKSFKRGEASTPSWGLDVAAALYGSTLDALTWQYYMQ